MNLEFGFDAPLMLMVLWIVRVRQTLRFGMTRTAS